MYNILHILYFTILLPGIICMCVYWSPDQQLLECWWTCIHIKHTVTILQHTTTTTTLTMTTTQMEQVWYKAWDTSDNMSWAVCMFFHSFIWLLTTFMFITRYDKEIKYNNNNNVQRWRQRWHRGKQCGTRPKTHHLTCLGPLVCFFFFISLLTTSFITRYYTTRYNHNTTTTHTTTCTTTMYNHHHIWPLAPPHTPTCTTCMTTTCTTITYNDNHVWRQPPQHVWRWHICDMYYDPMSHGRIHFIFNFQPKTHHSKLYDLSWAICMFFFLIYLF